MESCKSHIGSGGSDHVVGYKTIKDRKSEECTGVIIEGKCPFAGMKRFSKDGSCSAGKKPMHKSHNRGLIDGHAGPSAKAPEQYFKSLQHKEDMQHAWDTAG